MEEFQKELDTELKYDPRESLGNKFEEKDHSIWYIALSWILKIPLIALIIGSWGASWYAAYYMQQGINYIVPIIYTGIIALFLIGWFMKSRT